MSVTMYGPTYQTRNKRFVMDDDMASILAGYQYKSRKVFLEAFFEGIEAGRIVEVESTTLHRSDRAQRGRITGGGRRDAASQ